MSMTSLTHYKKPSNRHRNSGELDVFEASQYFSGYSDNSTLVGSANMTPNIVLKEQKQANYLRVGRRISLDMPSQRHHHYYHHNHLENHPVFYHHHHHVEQQQVKEKKHKQQPNSPGGKLANFLNSIFNQTSSRRKKSSKSSTGTPSLKDEDESYNGRRKRRSSISHFWSSNNSVADTKTIYSSSSSGFRTPPPNNLTTPIQSCKEFRSFAEHKDFLATLSKLSNSNGNGNVKKDDKMRSSGSKLNWVDEKIKSKSGVFEKPMNMYMFNNRYHEKNRETNEYSEETMDDGGDSDSSSDLFELNIDHGYRFCSTGLSVYENTHMDINISSGTPITIKN